MQLLIHVMTGSSSLAGHTYFASARQGYPQGKGWRGKIRMVHVDRFLCISARMLAAPNQIAASVIMGQNQVTIMRLCSHLVDEMAFSDSSAV